MATTRKTEGDIDEVLSNLSKEGVEALSRIWAMNDEETMRMGREARRRALEEAEALVKEKAQDATREKGK